MRTILIALICLVGTATVAGQELSADRFQRALNAIRAEREAAEQPVIVTPPEPIQEPEPEPTIEFTEPEIVVSTPTESTVRFFVSESWCRNCPPAKARFIASGGLEKNIISITTARQMGRTISSIPAEFSITTTSTDSRESINPPTYRSQWPARVTINGTDRPSKTLTLSHLRGGGPHKGKHWQAWHLENWRVEQLVALHDDDHAGTVPIFTPIRPDGEVIATINGADPTIGTGIAALAEYLTRAARPETEPEQPFGATIDATVNGTAVEILSKLMTDRRYEIPSAGVVVSWDGPSRRFDLLADRVTITPGLTVSAKRWGITVETTMTAIRYSPDFKTITAELTKMPDLTIRINQ